MMYWKQIMVSIVIVCSFQLAGAQTSYINYTIKSGETLSAIAKKYNTTVGDIMRLNGMHASSKINAGDKIKIPSKTPVTSARERVSATAPTTTTTSASNEKTHVVTKGETLFSVSKKYGITVDQLKTWNHLTSDNVNTGMLLNVRQPSTASVSSNTAPVQQPAAQTPPPAPQKQRVETTAQQAQKITDTVATTTDETTTPQNNSFASAMATPANAQIQANANEAAAQQTLSLNYTGNGYFASQFNKNKSGLKTVSGVSKTFKTASGWSDGKYYILANDIEPGTIVKLTADNGKSVFAKVLWNMGDLKDNAGTNFRISNATAAALHENTDSFNLNVSF